MPLQKVWTLSLCNMEPWKGLGGGVVCYFVFGVGSTEEQVPCTRWKIEKGQKGIEDVFKGCNVVIVCFSNRLISCYVWRTHWRTRNRTVDDHL